LSQRLVVKNKVVGILEKRKIRQHLSAEGAEAGVILRKLCTRENILKCRQEAVRLEMAVRDMVY
jgi:hypothetical protein